jgi:hypothetical protein
VTVALLAVRRLRQAQVRARLRAAVSAFQRLASADMVGQIDEQAMIDGQGRTRLPARRHLDMV